jgi:hypothetical protein
MTEEYYYEGEQDNNRWVGLAVSLLTKKWVLIGIGAFVIIVLLVLLVSSITSVVVAQSNVYLSSIATTAGQVTNTANPFLELFGITTEEGADEAVSVYEVTGGAGEQKIMNINGRMVHMPLIDIENTNRISALVTIRSAETGRPDSVYAPNDRDSCGAYQQRVIELYGNNSKAQVTKDILGDEYDKILSSERLVNIKRWNDKAYRVIQDGELYFAPIVGGWYVNYGNEMTKICKDLTDNHMKTGLFDHIALARFQERGILDYIDNYDLSGSVTDFAYAICNSQAPADCGHWVRNALPGLRAYLSSLD